MNDGIAQKIKNMIKDNKILNVIAQFHTRMAEESALMQTFGREEGMKRRDEFLLSVGEESAIFLNSLAKSSKPKVILEIGTSYGYSTIWLAEAAKSCGGTVISLEIDTAKSKFAETKIMEAGLSEYVNFVIGDALEYLANSPEKFDFVLLDIWKELYVPCFDLFFPKLNKSAWVISDNIIFPPHSRAEMDIFRKHLKNTNAFDSVLLPIGSGMEVSQLL